MRVVYPVTLKPGTPWWIRRHIRRREREVDRLWRWEYRIGVAIELVIIAMLVMCIIHFHIKFA